MRHSAEHREIQRNLRKQKIRFLKNNWDLYLFLIPGISYFILFHYIPMYGVQLAFRDFNPLQGITGSDWVGLDHFQRLVTSYQFWPILRNTFVLNIYGFLWTFPIPILLALMLNQMRQQRYKKFIQTIIYAPNFISVVVVVGMLRVFLSPRVGFLSHLFVALGAKERMFIAVPEFFRSLYIGSGIWQTAGFGSIIYLAALASVNPELHEAAIVDGAGKLGRIRHIDIPAITPTIIIMLLMALGSALAVGFEKVFLLQSPLNLPVSEVISTYTYQVGLVDGDFGFSTAVGLFNSLVCLVLLVLFNKISAKVTEVSLW